MIVRATRLSLALPLLAILFPSPAAAAFVTLSGTVTDESGVGIAGVQINFVDSCTGLTAAAIGNVTSSTGTFRATINPSVYDVEFVPPALPSLFTAYRILDFDLTTSRTLTDAAGNPAPIKLPYGVIVSGKVTDAAGTGIPNVYLHFFPPGSSVRVYTVRDKTDAAGNYSVVVPLPAVPPGAYDLHYGPPLGTRYVALARPSVPIPGNEPLLPVVLQNGLLVSGSVFNSAGAGHPVINVNINADDAVTGASLTLSHDRTDATGTYTVTVPPGTYRFKYEPKFEPKTCDLLVAQESAATAVSADLTLPPVLLEPGVLVRGTVTDTRLAPVADVDVDYIGSSGIKLLTPGDHTDTTGAYSAVVPPDTYSIEYNPPVGRPLAGVKVTGITINNNPPPLPTVQLPDGYFVAGRTLTVSGGPIYNVDLSFFPAGTTIAKIYVSHHHTDAAGNFSVVVVPGNYDIRFEPPSTAPLAAKRLLGISVGADLPLGDVVLLRGYVVTGHVSDAGGGPVVSADLDFYDANTHVKMETPHDNTDTSGNYNVTVPARLYNIVFQPAAGDPLETGRLAGVSITSNVSGLDIVLGGAALVSGRVRDSFSNPIANVNLDFYNSVSGMPQAVSRDHTATDGTFGVYVPPGTYDIVFTPPAVLGLAATRLGALPVPADLDLGDIVLSRALVPAVSSITPSSGPSDGGSAVSILGSGFQEGVQVTLGGLGLLGVRMIGGSQITGVTPGCPIGSAGAAVDLAVTNVGAATIVLPGAFTCTPTPLPVRVTATWSPPSIVLSWPSTGQPFYTIFRSTAPNRFGQAEVLAIVDSTATSFVDVGADADGVNYFYRVD